MRYKQNRAVSFVAGMCQREALTFCSIRMQVTVQIVLLARKPKPMVGTCVPGTRIRIYDVLKLAVLCTEIASCIS